MLLVDTNTAHTAAARTSGLPTFQGSVLSHRFAEDAPLDGIGNLLALTPSDEVNRLAVEQFVPTFGRPNLYRAASAAAAKHQEAQTGRALFAEDLDVLTLRGQLEGGARIRATKLTEKFGPEDYAEQYGDRARPLFLVGPERRLQVVTADAPPAPKVGQTVLAMVAAEPDADAAPDAPA